MKHTTLSHLLVAFVILCSFQLKAQINYTFSALAGTYTANATPTVLYGEATDFGMSPMTNIGFTFNFGGTNYTQFRAGPDGYISFNASAWGSGWNDLTGTGERAVIAPLWDDLYTHTAGGTANDGSVNYKLTGTAPNRVLTVEWKKIDWYWGSNVTAISFQAKLYETTNVIDFVYFQEAGAVVSGSASIGLAGPCTGDFYSLNNTGTGPVASKTTETISISTKPATGQIYRWTPATTTLTNDLCANAISIPYNLGSCITTAGTVVGATATGSPAAPACWAPATTSHDVWYSVVKPAGQTGMIVSLDNTSSACNSFGTAFGVYSGVCGGLTLIGCADNGGTLNPNNAVLTLSGLPVAATTYRIRVEGDATTTGTFQICVRDPLCPSSLGTGVTNVAALPYSISGQTTCGAVDDLTSTNLTACGTSWYNSAEDAVYSFTPATSGNVTATLTSTSFWVGLQLYQGCPLIGGGGSCVNYAQSSDGNQSICANVTAGQIYYLIVDQDNWGGCIPAPYSLSISAPAGIPAGTTCANPVNIASLPYSAIGETTACFGDDYTNASTGSCGSWYESGEDKVYRYVASGPECIGVSLTNASAMWSIGFQVYSGCPGTAGTTCIGSYGGSSPLNGSVVLPSAGTYYIIIDTWASPTSTSYDIAITSYGSGPVNDLPCSATLLTLGSPTAGDNNCSGGTGEPAWSACGWAGNLNTVWYQVVCPASGQLRIMTSLGTLYDSQIDVFSGTCAALTAVPGGCNDNATICTSGTNYYSLLTLTGLTAGATYWIRVDGYSDYIGSFSITASDASIIPPPTVQDCSGSISVCTAGPITQTVSYFGCGSTNDIPPSGSTGNPSTNVSSTNAGCLNAGERNSLWYRIDVSANGILRWTLSNPVGSIYDWSLYPITTSTCANIAANLVVPVRCNWNSGSNTVGTGMQSPVPAGGIAANFEAPLNVTAGQSFVLCVTNYSGTSGGTTIDFTGSTSGFGAPTTITWTGSISTAWATAANWGNCAPPTCTMNAVISPSTNQPIVSVASTVRNLTINAGATLTINPGITLTICGDFTNNGTLIADPSSTVLFNNAAVTHTLSGNMTGTSKFGNITITKTGGSVITNDNIDIGGNFLTSNATSIFNTTGKYVRVGRNFTNFSAGTTYTNSGTTGTLEFNGTVAQNYSPGGNLTLNHVTMNHTGTGVTLVGNNMLLGTSGILTLTLGKIITGAFEVRVNNTAPAAVTAGNTSSYVEGFLRRYLSATGSFDFPVGHSTKGYERANVNFTAATTISNLLASFNPYGTVPAALGSSECAVTYNMPALDDGRWTINAYNVALTQILGTGTYTMTLYNRIGSYTNGTGSTAWTVMKDPGSGWALNGTCATSTINQVVRTGMVGFSNFGTAQSMSPLPIELLSFTGKSLGKTNQLEWATASETNNDFFTVEHSADGNYFQEVVVVDGAGNSTATNNYSALDQEPYNGITYYKLKQTDFNGDHTFSDIITIENHLDEINVNNIRPNPTSGLLNLDFFTPFKGKVHLIITDIYGRIVYNETVSVNDGKNVLATDLGILANGIYSLKVSMEEYNFFSVNKIVKN